ncbi:hypothetical protein V5799_004371 [Amblyomma americanum]|uniref:Uncharacterized protein n=1 Tax=Amblyomma americanum TaxID=6943 RepID=A0AAQ4D6A7_AMBAM
MPLAFLVHRTPPPAPFAASSPRCFLAVHSFATPIEPSHSRNRRCRRPVQRPPVPAPEQFSLAEPSAAGRLICKAFVFGNRSITRPTQ